MSKSTIFYSWQSEDSQTRKYIEKHLRRAIKRVDNDSTFDKRPEFDKDTLGVLGAPDILTTIKEKISKCEILVADISIIGSNKGKKIVNQNVMFEIGYMIGSNSSDKLVLLFNSDNGNIKDAPFDIQHHKVMQFSIKSDPSGVEFEKELTRIIKIYLSKKDSKNPNSELIDALDEREKQIMTLFSTIQDDVRILTTMTMGGAIITPTGAYNKEIYDKTIESIGEQRMVAIMDDLFNKGILDKKYGSKGTPNYTPTGTGFKIIDAIKESAKDEQ